MLSPTSAPKNLEPSFTQQREMYPQFLHPSPSTIQSLEAQGKKNAMETIKHYIFAVLDFFKRILGLTPPKKKQVENLSTFSPSQLDPADPFREKVFLVHSDGKWEFNNKRAFELVSYIFFTQLGTLGPMGWYWNWNEINKAKKELVTIKQHPFEFLYFILHSSKSTGHLMHFEANATGSLTERLSRLCGQGKPWEQFLNRQVANFENRKKEIAPFIPGFCQALGLEREKVETFAQAGQWKEMILYAYKERQKQFQLYDSTH